VSDVIVSTRERGRTVLRRASGAIALLASLWLIWLIVSDGGAVTVFGVLIRSHDRLRPLVLFAISIALFLFSGGYAACVNALAGVASRPVVRLLSSRVAHHVLVTTLSVVLLVIGIAYGSTTAGGSDSYGYLSQADLWLSGRLTIPQPWVKDVPWPKAMETFSPLGYLQHGPTMFTLGGFQRERDPWAIVPAYSPGLPMLMAIGKTIGGACGPFVVVPLAGALLVLSTYLIGIRLASSTLGLLAALLLATSPPFLLMHFVNMSDVPVAAAMAIAWWCLLGTSIGSAAGGSLALAAVLLIRPNLVPLVPIIVGWLAWRIWQERRDRSRHLWRAAIVLGGIGAASLVTADIYWLLHGSPFQSGYGATEAYFSPSHVGPNLRNYATWFTEAHTPLAVLGFVALAFPVKALWPDVADRSAVAAFALLTVIVIVEFLFYLVFDDSSYLRFLLVFYPFIMLGLASIAQAIARLHRLAGPALAVTLLLVVCANGVRVSLEWRVFNQGLLEAKIADVADHVRRATSDNSVVLAGQHSGSVRYYAGRVTMRWDALPEDWLDKAVAWMAERGVHTYALFDDYEHALAVKRFAGQKLDAVFAGEPVFRFGNKVFYDLGLPPETKVETVNLPVVDIAPRCWTAQPPPRLVWK
jgi:hypothetical protein